MQAQHSIHATDEQRVQLARLLLQANLAYGEANSPVSVVQSLKARRECRTYLGEILDQDPGNAAALGLLGRVEMDDGDLEQAQRLFTRSLSVDSNQPQQYTNLGYWAIRSERPTLAEQHFAQALELDRQSAAAFCGIAHAKRIQGAFDVAYLHYRKLLQTGLEWPSVYSGMLQCAANLDVNSADPELAQDAIALLRHDGLPHQELGRFVAAIIRQQYGLADPDAQISLEHASQDSLLLLALNKTLMPDPAVEELVSLLRRSVLAEVAQTAELRDELQALALALAVYNDRTGYALTADADEERLVDAINSGISAQLALGDSQDSLIGSLILSAMYGALFHQNFAVQLGAWNLVDWPLAMQAAMAASFYDRGAEEAIKQGFDEKSDELLFEKTDLPQAWPSWSTLSYHTPSSLKATLANELGLATDACPDTLRMMVCGARSGQRAMELAYYLSDVEVIAVDESLANIAKATRMAEDMGINNIVFWPWSVARRFLADDHKVHWIEIGRLPSANMTKVSLAEIACSGTASGAIVHMHTGVGEQTGGDRHIRELIARHNLQPTRPALRQLRKMVLNNRQDPVWTELVADPDFYALGGCRDRWFAEQDPQQLNELMALVSNEVDWKLVKARDTDGHSLATGPVQKQIRAEALGSEVQSVMGQGLSVYFQRRR
ncbi:tetratricopeptide repeat protein [Marinobacter sp.]|uniref:tetratricopeptide repeat protein n=1 Tax=Marinobacter sp. TaxID=50741 RepID=UPI002B47FA15|nr:tetratricopeptide repeat protein [Marinobacter sp.]HKK56407.1 tetratricopeptide repeat protein [Marinobacter sp.]